MRVQELALVVVTSLIAMFPLRVASAALIYPQEREVRIASNHGFNGIAFSSPLREEASLAFVTPEVRYFVESDKPVNGEPRLPMTTNDAVSRDRILLRDMAVDSLDGDFPVESDFPDVQIESELDSESSNSNSTSQKEFGNFLTEKISSLFESDSGVLGREGIGGTLKTIMVMTVVAIAPAFLLMTTSYVRISVVLFLLRQALGAGQIPSNQVVATLAVFLTVLVMSPVGVEVYQKAIVPYSENQISRDEAFQTGQEPVRTFLWKQIERTGNTEMISLFTKYLPDVDEPEFYEDIPWRALAPAFLLSELKTAFLIGFQIFLPFLVIDFVVSCVLVSTGMMMLPPAIISLPLKLALFVMVDGWTLVVKSLMESFV